MLLIKKNSGLKQFLLISLVLVSVTGAVLIPLIGRDEYARKKNDLTMLVRAVIFSLTPSEILSLSGTRNDLNNINYVKIKRNLAVLRMANPSIRFLYLMGMRSDTIIFLVDSEAPDSPDYSPPGQVYRESIEELTEVFTKGREKIHGPHTDAWGTWISALAPVRDPGTKRIIALVGADIAAADMAFAIIGRVRYISAMILFLLLSLIILYRFLKRNEESKEKIEKLEALRIDSEKNYHRIIENLDDFYYRIDVYGTILQVNPAFIRSFRYDSAEELIGSDVRSLWLHPDERGMFIAELNSAEQVRDYVIPGLRKDGTTFYASISAHLIRNVTGEIVGYEGLLRDVTEQKEREIRYREYNAMFATLVQSLSGGDVGAQIQLLAELSADVLDVKIAGVWRFDLNTYRGYSVDLYDRTAGVHYTQYTTDILEMRDYIQLQKQSTVVSSSDAYGEMLVNKIPRNVLDEFNISSLMEAPVFIDGEIWGMLVFWHSGEKRKWLPEEEQAAITLSAHVSIIIETEERKKAISALRESEERFRSIAEQVTDIIFVTDKTGVIQFASPSLSEVLGWKHDDVIQRKFLDFLPESEVESGVGAFQETILSRSPVKNIQLLICHKDGGNVFAEINIAPLWHNDSVIGTIGVIRDITERKMVEETIKAAMQRLRELEFIINQSPITVWVWRPEEGAPVRFVSEGVGALGYSADEMSGSSFQYKLIIHPDDVNRVMNEIDSYTQKGRDVFNQEYRVLTRSGDIRWVESRVIVKRKQDGAVDRYQGIVIDITERKEAENVLHKRDELQRMLMDLGAEFIHVSMDQVDTAITDALESIGKYTEVDRSFVFNYDFELSTVCCTHEWFANSLQPYMQRLQGIPFAPFSGLIASHRSGMTVVLNDQYNYRPDDPLYGYMKTHSIKSLLTIPLMNEGECLGFVAFCMVFHNKEWARDEINLLKVLAELYAKLEIQRRYETQLIDARKEAEMTSIARGEFLAGMSHEIRTPMNGVIGMAELILNTPLTPEQKRYAQIISSSGEHLLSLIDNILDYSKFEAGKLGLAAADFNLRQVFEDIIDFMALRAQEKGVEFVYIIEKNVLINLRGDAHRLKQVIINLAGNAIKFTENGEIVIKVTGISDTVDKIGLRFEVRDTGRGISEEKIKLLFQPFVQLDTLPGTGLGLVISQKITELMGGSIGVISKPEKGSTFWFEVEFDKAAQAETADESIRGMFAGQNVLIVDRSESSCRHLCGILESWDVRCAFAASSGEALRIFSEAHSSSAPFTAVIINSDDSSGFPEPETLEFSNHIKRKFREPDIALILMTKIAGYIDENTLRREGFSAKITKPVKYSALFDCLADLTGAADTSPAEMKSSYTGISGGGGTGLKPFTVLVVEDNAINQEIAVMMLQKLGYRAEVAQGGREALEALANGDYDLVLMDCQMQDIDGYATTAAIRNNSSNVKNHTVPIIAMTASAMREDRDRCLAAGMNDFLAKPMQIKTLDETLARWLDAEKPGIVNNGEHTAGDIENAVGANEPVFEQKLLEDKLLIDKNLVNTIITLFKEKTPIQISDLLEALVTNDRKRARRLAHTMKGASAQMGARRIFTIAAEIELLAEQDNLEAISPYIDMLQSEFKKYIDTVTDWKMKNDLST